MKKEREYLLMYGICLRKKELPGKLHISYQNLGNVDTYIKTLLNSIRLTHGITDIEIRTPPHGSHMRGNNFLRNYD